MISTKSKRRKTLGGLGSGNWYRFDKKATTAEANALDVRNLHRQGLLKAGRSFSSRWLRGDRETGSIGGVVEGTSGGLPGRVVLSYRHRNAAGGEWEDVRETVPLEWTPCNFGGERPWFLCPGVGCGRRVAVLYGPGKYFLCRHCYDLVYESQRENGMNRALRQAQNIRTRLGGGANMLEPFPEKPKGMHWRTYDRLRREHHDAETEQLAGMREWLDRLGQKMG